MTAHQHKTLKTKLINLKQQCPMPVLLRKLGLGAYGKSSCRSPLRADQTASWGIFQRQGQWFFKDHGNHDSGDEVTLLARLNKLDIKRDFKRIVECYADTAASNEAVEAVQSLPAIIQPPSTPPILSRFSVGTADQLNRLALLRGFSREGLQLASQRGFLIFGVKHNFEVYGVKDQSGLIGEVRRLDGQLFAATDSTPAHKSHTLKGSSKNWPLGIVEAAGCSKIAMTEGLPDFLACFDFIHREHKVDVVSPVAMLAASVVIDSQALPRFSNKQVRLYPHYDQAGIEAAKRWTRQLNGIAASISYFKFSEFDSINDLADLNRCFNTNPTANIEILL